MPRPPDVACWGTFNRVHRGDVMVKATLGTTVVRWPIWQATQRAELWEAVLLSLNVEPAEWAPARLNGDIRDIRYIMGAYGGKQMSTPGFSERLRACRRALNELGPIRTPPLWRIDAENDPDRCVVLLAEVGNFLRNAGYSVTPEMGAPTQSTGGEPTGTPSVVAPEPDAAVDDRPATSHEPVAVNLPWKMRTQAFAAEKWQELRKSGANPTVASITPIVAKWCRENNVLTATRINPSDGYLRTHVLGGKHWRPPS